MNKVIRIVLVVIAILIVAGGLVLAGTWIGAAASYRLGWHQPTYRMMGGVDQPGRAGGYGMMGAGRRSGGYGMMGAGRRSGGFGMMDANDSSSAAPLTVDQAYQAAGKYLASLNNPDLKIAEVMVFDNNAYIRVVEKSTGIGAFELLVDPASLAVFPEHGPNMMWNLKYAGMNHLNGMGGRGGMMGNFNLSATPATVSATMPVTSAQALQAAQQYLDKALPGSKTSADADPFYGYYTIDILRDGKITGMLSVNGYSGQVFLHTWHGTFLATQDY